MIDSTKLTEDQLLGAQYATKLANETDDTVLTVDEYLEKVVRGACDSYFSTLAVVKSEKVVEKFKQLSKVEQKALEDQLEVEDVLKVKEPKVVEEELPPVVEEPVAPELPPVVEEPVAPELPPVVPNDPGKPV